MTGITPLLGKPLLITRLLVMMLAIVTRCTAAPPLWESDFGEVLADLTGQDNGEVAVVLTSFSFPFGGTDYTTVHVGTNGGLQLGGKGVDDEIDLNYWDNFNGFAHDGGYPNIMPFNTDLDLTSAGTIHFKDFGDRAVYTWNEVGTNEESEHLLTFQVQLYDTGKIVFGYNGILDSRCGDEDLLDSLSEGILVGISKSNGENDPGGSDLNDIGFPTSSTTIYQLWCYDETDSCDGDRTGPTNSAFDLDFHSIVFEPNPAGAAGFTVSSLAGAPDIPDPPPVWESAFGEILSDLTECDDDQDDVELSFSFPFGDNDYTTVYVGTNGGVQLGSDGDDGCIDYDNWECFDEFNDDGGYPNIMPLNTDLDLSSAGTIHFNDFGNRAVFTWNEVGAYDEELHLFTFQIQLLASGQIIFGYNGILNNEECNEDLLESLNEGILVGITESTGADDPGGSDLDSGQFSTSSSTIYQLWCFDEADSCDGDRAGPTNRAFDLDYQNVFFTPNAGGGFLVSNERPKFCQAPTDGRMLFGKDTKISHGEPLGSKNLRGATASRSLKDDPCNGECDFREECILNPSSQTYSCVCKPGYSFNEAARNCQPDDECVLDYPCPGEVESVPSSFCVDYAPPFRYKCGCLPGFKAVLPFKNDSITEPVPLEWRPLECIEEDECLSAPCHPNATCDNTVGGFSCTCDGGLVGDGFVCVETIEEVEEQLDACANQCRFDENQVCAPSEVTAGIFACLCATGFEQIREGSRCSDADECDPVNPSHDCDENGYCTNIPGSFTCECNPGFVGGGRECTITLPPTATPSAAPSQAPVTPTPQPTFSPTPRPPPPVCAIRGTTCAQAGDCCSGICTENEA